MLPKNLADQDFQSASESLETKINKLGKDQAAQYQAVKDAKAAVDRARETIKKSVEKIWNKHQDAFSPGDLNGVLQAVGQRVHRQGLCIQRREKHLVSTELKERITQRVAELSQLSSGDQEYVHSIAVNRKSFEDLVNTYFVDLSSTDPSTANPKEVYLVGARNTHAAADPDTRRIDVTSTWDIIWAGRQ
ncbi:hypothetical protein B0T25DRAFT_516320 [Lasiosphaeria hispida]|uniref:Uncharacterized protein n=1 Tax=Lasiosphaeria hispida TaxID=260671 RepID=A0AAJ0HKU6_9PEZI|nr:hypothetical protein B0T25DRAFT_516320 [Lasiosphaeria hispida]